MKIRTKNPYNGKVLKEYDVISTSDALSIAQESRKAFTHWKDISSSEKKKLFLNLSKELNKNKSEYAALITAEMGKPISESLGEIEKCALLAEVLAKNGESWLAPEKVSADGKEHVITFEPLGPIFIIMPWNYPFWQVFKVALPPLFAGNTILLKHASNVTGSSLAIEKIFTQAGFPNNVFNSLVINHETSNSLIESDEVAACSLTGSVSAGSKIAEHAGKNIKKIVLELGGSDPLLVLEDSDLDIAAQAAVNGRTSNAGQVCIGSKRIIVHKKIAQAFSEKFTEKINNLKVGDPLDPETQIGPLANEQAVKDMEAFVQDAVSKGGKLLTGGVRLKGKNAQGNFFLPAVLIQTTPQMNAVCQETFGPIAPIIIANDDEEMIAIANNTEFGLSASIWTKNIERAKKIAKKINAGAVFINSTSKSHPLLPIGGIKKSGFGRELSRYGIKEFVNIKTINVYDQR